MAQRITKKDVETKLCRINQALARTRQPNELIEMQIYNPDGNANRYQIFASGPNSFDRHATGSRAAYDFLDGLEIGLNLSSYTFLVPEA